MITEDETMTARFAAPTPTAVSVAGLRKAFGATVAVAGVSFDIRAREFVAVVGPSGCGKSTLLRLIAGLVRPDAGSVMIAGDEVAGGRWVPPERRSVGIVFQEDALFPHLSVARNVAFGLRGLGKAERRRRVAEVLDLVQLSTYGDRYPHELSGGERQRVALARALAPDPTVMLLDEPFANLDPNLRIQVRGETVDILRRAGATTLFVTHDQQDALVVGDRVAVMRGGRVEQLDTPEAVFHRPANRFVACFLGEADFLPAWPVAGGVMTEAGPCPAPDHVDRDMEIMVRPHEVTFAPDPAGPARVAAVEFQGGFLLYELLLGSGRRVRSLQPHHIDIPVGTSVTVHLQHGHAPAVL